MLGLILFALNPLAETDLTFRQVMDIRCMSSVLQQSDPRSDVHLRDILTHNKDDPANACDWLGVECEDSRITSFIFSTSASYRWEVNLKWFPPTIHFLHLTCLYLIDPLQSDTLPRDLLYISLTTCTWRAHRELGFGTFDFRRLPQKIEEFILISSWMAGTLLLDELPSSVRIVQIFSNYVTKVVVGVTVAPPDLKRITICGNIRTNVFGDEGSALKDIVSTSTKHLDFEQSLYYKKFRNAAEMLWNDKRGKFSEFLAE